jgi:TolB protein
VRRRCGVRSSLLGVSAFLLLLALALISFPIASDAKVYIDVTSPNIKKMPIAIYDFPGPHGREIAEILRKDLTFTGLFLYVSKSSYIEALSEPFDPQNWTPLGIDAVVKGNSMGGRTLTVTVTLYDPFEGREILSKQYQSEKELVRPLSHSIANDIYAALTGENGIFRTRIAFVGEAKAEKDIYVADWDGHRSRKLGFKGTLLLSPHWSPDGTKMIYSSEQGRQWGIYLLDFRRMTEKRLFVSAGINLAGDFFPKGDKFAFSSSKGGTPDLYLFDIGSAAASKLTSTYGIEVSPAVSPDGKYIAFVSDRGGSPQIYTMHADGSEVKRVTFQGSYNTSPNWSPLGDRLAFSGRFGGKNQIFTVKPDGSDLMALTDSGNNEDPSFSPDGRYITFSSDREGGKGIYIMRANGESQTRITPRNIRAFGPRWSTN